MQNCRRHFRHRHPASRLLAAPAIGRNPFNDANCAPNVDIVTTAIFLEGALILLQFYFVWLAVQSRVGWPRWALTAMLLLSVISLLQTIGVEGMHLVSAIEIVSCALTAVGLYLSFTGNARGWFNG
jgi:hypothetical protein